MAGRSGSKKRLKGVSVRVRVAPEQRDLIERKAQQADVTMSEFIRQAALGREVRSVADRKAMADLNRLGGLLKWWLTDGKGKDGERHIRGKATPMHVPKITDLLRDIERTVLRVIAPSNDSMDDDLFEDAEVDDVGDEDDR